MGETTSKGKNENHPSTTPHPSKKHNTFVLNNTKLILAKSRTNERQTYPITKTPIEFGFLPSSSFAKESVLKNKDDNSLGHYITLLITTGRWIGNKP